MPLCNYRSIQNTDQTVFELEVRSTRTLSYVGEKATLLSVGSSNKITHRYTVQQIINMAREFVGPLFIYLQEKNGVMGERVRKNLFRADNINGTCSASGKLTTSLIKYWIKNCLSLFICDSRTRLLSDSWRGEDDKHGLYNCIRGLKRLQILQKPR
ncbi:unnamed protein product [Adineta ricciae]|uniref:Uncharacterized protein n=1 Tax=Adineta ricciae TaxID=249248 RepID=A0A815UXP4_ADIRI|nr:unnamed protein product [Adineta ricciae]CAF1622706.1 unnamed protein product [Adineta ricciae]